MATFLEALGQVARQTYCFALGNFDNAARAYGRIAIGPAAISRVSGAVRAQLCNGPPTPTPLPPPPFNGGQCPVAYNITWEQRTQAPGGGFQWTARSRIAPGLIGPVSITSSDAPLDCDPPLRASQEGIRGFNGGGATLLGTGGCGDIIPGYRNLVLTRRDGQADNCGDPPIVVPPPGDIIIEGDDVTYEGDDNVNITVPTAFVFAPVYVDLDGSLTVPFTVDVGGVEFSGTLEVAPEFTFNIRPKDIDGGPGNVDDPTVPDEVDDPTPPPDEEEDALPIIGVLVFSNLDDSNRATELSSDGGPNILAPRIGSVQFAIKTGNSIAWTSDQDVKSNEAYIPCIPPQGAVAVRVTFAPGAVGRFTPVRGRPLTTA